MNDTMVPRGDAELNEALYNAIIGSQSAKTNTVREAWSTMVRRARFTIYLTIFLQSFCSLLSLLFCHNINQGMDVEGVPLFYTTYSFGFGNNCQQRDLPLFGVLWWQKCGSFFLL